MVLVEINSEKPIYMILDRLDRCDADVKGFVSFFLDLVTSHTNYVLKILIMANSSGWDVENEDLDRWVESAGKDVLKVELGWDQKELVQ